VQRGDQALRHVARGAPDDVVARQAVAVAVQAAFDPVHGGHELQALGGQPVIDAGARVFDVMPRPLQRPMVAGVGGVEFAEAQPVGQRALGRVGDLHLRLQRRADQRHAAEGPQRQTAETLGAVAVDQRHAPSGAQQLQCGDDAGQAAAHHHGIAWLHCTHVFGLRLGQGRGRRGALFGRNDRLRPSSAIDFTGHSARCAAWA
jgi:hypothetical protein